MLKENHTRESSDDTLEDLLCDGLECIVIMVNESISVRSGALIISWKSVGVVGKFKARSEKRGRWGISAGWEGVE